MAEKQTFVMYKAWRQLFKGLPPGQAADLICAIYDYQVTGTIETKDPAVIAIFNMMREKFDEDSLKYQETCRKRREAGAKGGRPKCSKSKAKESYKNHLVSDAKQMGSNSPPEYEYEYDSVSVYDNVSVSDNVSISDNVAVSKNIDNNLHNSYSCCRGDNIQEPYSDPAAAAVIKTLEECGFQINPYVAQQFLSMMDDFGEHWVKEAIRRASDANARNVRYVGGILRSWREKGGVDERNQKNDHGYKSSAQNQAADELDEFYNMAAEWAEEYGGD